jgi:UDP-GlcNAc:undecaprenyl-phosphate GlcNAc-1-phosphate transferase
VLTSLLTIAGVSCALSLVLTPLARALAARFRLVDCPDGRRKVHARATPVAGGMAILASCALALAGAAAFFPAAGEQFLARGQALLGLALAAVTICAVGVADDYGALRGRHKLAGQFLAVVVLVCFGIRVTNIHLFGWDIDLGLLAVPFTAAWLLGAINSLNLIDGLDGLLTTVALIISLALAVLAALQGQWVAACLAGALAGALLGFLRYNFPPASVFLGDSGSMLIGLLVGTLAVQGSMKGPATVALATPAALLTVPFFDTAAAIIRRKLTGRSIYTTDRGHLHHCLLRHGFSNRGVLLWVALFCLLTVCGALASQALQSELFAVMSALAVVAILVASRMFGHVECVLVKERLLAAVGSFCSWRAPRRARQIQVRLQGSADWKGLWDALVACAARLNVKMLRLNVNAPALHEGYHAQWGDVRDDAEESTLWRAEIPLTVRGQLLGRLEVSGPRDQEAMWLKIAAVAEVLERFEVLGPGATVSTVAAPALTGVRPPLSEVNPVAARS